MDAVCCCYYFNSKSHLLDDNYQQKLQAAGGVCVSVCLLCFSHFSIVFLCVCVLYQSLLSIPTCWWFFSLCHNMSCLNYCAELLLKFSTIRHLSVIKYMALSLLHWKLLFSISSLSLHQLCFSHSSVIHNLHHRIE